MTDSSLRRELRPALVLFAALTLVTGVLYPLAVRGVAQLVFPAQANGSLVHDGDHVVGSALIGQSFHGDGWFQSRPSAAGGGAYLGMPSSGSNLGPTNPALVESYRMRAAALRAANPVTGTIPVDLLTASGSGLDPDISPAAALLQVERVASARHLAVPDVRNLVARRTQPRQFGLLGESRVNVLLLNLDLITLSGGVR